MRCCMKFMRHGLLLSLIVTALIVSGCGIRGGEMSLPWISAESVPTLEPASEAVAERQQGAYPAPGDSDDGYPQPPIDLPLVTPQTGYPDPGIATTVPVATQDPAGYPAPVTPTTASDYPAPVQPTQSSGYPLQPTATPLPQVTVTAVPATTVPTAQATTVATAAPVATSDSSYPIPPVPTSDSAYPPSDATPPQDGDGYPQPATATSTVVPSTATSTATLQPTATTQSATATPRATATVAPAATATGVATLPPIVVSTVTPVPQPTATNRPSTATPTAAPIPTATPVPVAPTATAIVVPTAIPLPTQVPQVVATATAPSGGETVLVGHRVLPGENLFSIGRFYGVSVQDLIRVNNIPNAGLIYAGTEIQIPLPAGSQAPEQPSRPVTTVAHVIKPGESLGYLSVLYDVSLSELVSANNISNPDIIFIGTTLQIPFADGGIAVAPAPELKTTNHVIRPGETLSGLSAFYDVSQSDLIRLNNIANPDLIRIGSVIRVPTSISAEDRSNFAATDTGRSDTTESGNAVHLVESGDTLLGIAAHYRVSVFDLTRLNGIEPDAYVLTGQRLALPANASLKSTAVSDTIVELLEDAENSAEKAGSLQLAGAKGDIFMIVDGSLVRVDAEQGMLAVVVAVEPIVDGLGAVPFGRYAGTGPTILGSRAVIDFRINSTNDRMVVLRAWESTERIAYDILHVDLTTGEQRALASNLNAVLDIEWSQDEKWVSYIEVVSDTESGIYALSTTDQNYNTYIGSCQRQLNQSFDINCQGLSTDTSSSSVLYVDGRGVWRATFDGFAPTLITDYDSSGALMYDPISWSADGRYLLMWGGYIEGGQRFVYDNVTGRVAPVPFSSAYVYISAVSWLEGGNLLVLSPSVPGSGQRPVASVFSINGDSETFLTLERDITLPTVSSYNSERNAFPGVQVWSQDSFAGQKGSFAIVSTDDRESGVYLLNLDDSTVKRLNGLPDVTAENYVREVVWSPDGSGALLVYSVGQNVNRVYWISADVDTPTELPISEAVCCLQWK